MSGVMVFNPSGMEENPRRKKKRGKSRRSSGRRASARRNPGNPPRRRTRRRTYRNPGMRFGGLDFKQVGFGVAGAIGTDLGGEYLTRMLPAELQSGAGKYAVKGGLVLLGSMLLGRIVGRQAGASMALGGAIMLGAEAVHEFVLPAVTKAAPAGASGYLTDDAVNGYIPDAGVSGWSPGWAGNEAL